MTREGKSLVFVDAFAGCGGFSLGLMKAGLTGLFAIEKDKFAFATLYANLLASDGRHTFAWPPWLPKSPTTVEDLISGYNVHLKTLRGKVDVLAGGPPCQGFSTAGRRRINDPRNRLFKSYVKLVQILEPRIVLMENVRGFTMDFSGDHQVDNYAAKLRSLLSKRYIVHERLIDVSRFGVPQLRTRYLLIAMLPDLGKVDPFAIIEERRQSFLRRLNLQVPVSSASAISDLEVRRCGTKPSKEFPGFLEIKQGPRRTTFQKFLSEGCNETSDLRLARHTPEISQRFEEIIEICKCEGRLNTTISPDTRARYGLKKHALRVLDPDRPSPTITSMPDDLLHYSEPRTLTVRETARLQSFPDWFSFHGKYTTGGDLRRREVPRFTQVANAVPPLTAQAIGEALVALATPATRASPSHQELPCVRKNSMKFTERQAGAK
jgi:DNA (cytosine-5)-methyltransferase 1